MNQQRLEELTKRAEKAKELAEDLAKLEAADPQVGSHNYSFKTWNTNSDHWPERMLKEVLAAGRRALIAKKEAELEALLGSDEVRGAEVATSGTVSTNETFVPSCDSLGAANGRWVMDVKCTFAALQGQPATDATAHKIYAFKNSNAVANSGNIPLSQLLWQFDPGGKGQIAVHRYWIDDQGGENFYESLDYLRSIVQESSGSKIEFEC